MILSIEEITKKTTPIAIKHGVDSLGIFGSYARQATDDSDLDFIMMNLKINILKLLGTV